LQPGSAQSAKEIKTLSSESMAEVQGGSVLVEHAAACLTASTDATTERGRFRDRNFGNCVANATNGRHARASGGVRAVGDAGNLNRAGAWKKGICQRKWPAKAGHFALDASA
jgi:hypothetical protein